MENKASTLDKIKANYIYTSEKNNANESIANLKNKLTDLENMIPSVEKQVNNLNTFHNSVARLTIEPNIKEPNVKVKKGFYFGAGFVIWCIITLIIAVIFNNDTIDNVLFIAVIPIAWFIARKWYQKSKIDEYNRLYEEYNGVNIRTAEKSNESLRESAQQSATDLADIQAYLNELNSIKNNIDTNLLPEAENSLQEIEDNKPNLINVPVRRMTDPNFYLSLYEVINTEQADNMGSAIKIVEDRFEAAENSAEVRKQIVESQHAIQNTILNSAKEITSTINSGLKTMNANLMEVSQGIQKANDRMDTLDSNLKRINNNIAENTKEVASQLEVNRISLSNINGQIKALDSTAQAIQASSFKTYQKVSA